MMYTIQTKLHEYTRQGIAVFFLGALMLALLPQISTAIAETGSGIAAPEPTFPVSEDSEPRREMWVVATAYSSDPAQTDATPCTPAMGSFDLCKYYEEHGVENTIAANFLPLGTQVKFPEMYGDKIFVVRDRMNARYNGQNRIDFWIGSETPTSREIIQEAKQEARGFGVKQMKMEVYAR